MRYLEQQLRARTLAGKAVALAGISAATLAMLMPMSADAQIPADTNSLTADSVTATIGNSVKIKGVISDALDSEVLIGVTIHNLTNGTGTLSNIDGEFEIDACVSDSIKVSYFGYHTQTICVQNTFEPLAIKLEADSSQLTEDMLVLGGAISYSYERKENHYLDLNVIDEYGNLMDRDKLDVSRQCIPKQ